MRQFFDAVVDGWVGFFDENAKVSMQQVGDA